MTETLIFLNEIGVSPTAVALVGLIWKMDKRMSLVEYKLRDA